MGELLTLEQTAEILGVTSTTIRNYIRKGLLPRVKVGGRFVRVDRDDLEAFINGHKVLAGEAVK